MSGEINLLTFKGLFRTGRVYLVQRVIGHWVWFARVTRDRGAFYIETKTVKHIVHARLVQPGEIRAGDFLYYSRTKIRMLVRGKVQ